MFPLRYPRLPALIPAQRAAQVCPAFHPADLRKLGRYLRKFYTNKAFHDLLETHCGRLRLASGGFLTRSGQAPSPQASAVALGGGAAGERRGVVALDRQSPMLTTPSAFFAAASVLFIDTRLANGFTGTR